MDGSSKQLGEIDKDIDIDAWIREFAPDSDQLFDGNTETEGSMKFFQFDADFVSPLNGAGCSGDKSSNHDETKTDFTPDLPWNSKPMNCNSDSQQARTSEAPVHNSCPQSVSSTSEDLYNIVESSMHLKKSFGSQVLQSVMPQPNQQQIPQQPNNQSFVMHSNVQNSNQMEQRPIQLNKLPFFQQPLHRDWVGNNTSLLQNGLQAAPDYSIAGKRQHFQAFQQPQHTSGFQSRLSSMQAHPTAVHNNFLHLRNSRNQTDPSPQGSRQMMQASSLHSSQSPAAVFPQRPMGNPQGKFARGSSSGSSSSTPQINLPNSTEWSDHAYQQLQVMKEIYWAEVVKLYKKARDLCLKPQNAELSVNYEKTRLLLEKIIKFFQMSKVEFMQIRKEKVCEYMNFVAKYLDRVRMNNSAALQKHLQQLQVPKATPTMHQTGNEKFQFNQSTFGLCSSATHSSSQQEIFHPRASHIKSSGEVSIKGPEAAHGLSRNSITGISKWPIYQYMLSRQQNANIAASSQSSSHSELDQRSSRLPGSMAISSPANTVNSFGSALTLSQKRKQPMGSANPLLANTANPLGSPSTQLQKILQLEGQTVNKQKKLTDKSNEINESKVRHVGSNVRMLQHNNLIGKHSETLCKISPSNSNQLLSASPQNSQQSFQLSAISPSIGPSPLTPLTPSSVPESPQRVSSSLGKSLFSEGIKAPKVQSEPAKLDSQSINTSGILNMPSGMEPTHSEGSQSSERPIKRLIDAIESISQESLRASLCDIGNVVNMVDTRAGTLCYGDCRGSMGDDLVADVRSLQHNTNMDDKMERNINATTSNAFPSLLQESDGMDLANYMSPDTDSTATSIIKRPNTELKSKILQEIKETNRKLIETQVEMVADGSEDESIIIKCSYSPMGDFYSKMFTEMLVLELIIPGNYPNLSPIVLDKSPDLFSGKEVKSIYIEVKSRFNLSLRQLSEPMSIREMVKTWDICAHKVFTEFAKKMGGGTFSSVYGEWEKL